MSDDEVQLACIFCTYFILNLDYKRTSLKGCIQVFEDFLHGLEKEWKGKQIEQSGGYTLYFIYLYIFICL